MNSKLFRNAAAFVLLTVGAAGSVYALSDTEPCKDKLLEGRYGFTLQGTKFAGMGPTGSQIAWRWLTLAARAPLLRLIR
jgi:hypothetical protein